MYRFRTLDGARGKAAHMGWRGALYAWESADSGAESTPGQVIGPDRQVIDVLSGKQEQHISADVAYAVWQYWQATEDEGFLRDAGAEIILETSRFWSSRAQPEADGYRHVRGVIGPDEYHEHIDDNAFTNVMARWNIQRALDVVALLRERWPECWARLSRRLGLDDAELKQWRNVAETMATGLDPGTGLFEQFAGYFGLEEINLADYAGRSVPMDVVLGRERTQRSQVIKQADVVALLGLLPEEFVGEAGAANFHYREGNMVRDGWVTLTGSVDWHYQRKQAEEDARKLSGVRGVINTVEIEPSVQVEDVKRKIEEALRRHAKIEPNAIRVTVPERYKVVLEGKVGSWDERYAVENGCRLSATGEVGRGPHDRSICLR